MAQSPSLAPMGFGSSHQAYRRMTPPSPPPTAQPMSKRDKKRSAIENRLREIQASFTANRDTHLRNQLNLISRDIVFITQANPYQNRPLDDTPEGLSLDLTSLGVAAAADADTRLPLGCHALEYVDGVNDALEERDADLTDIQLLFDHNVQQMRMEFEFALEVAEAEEQALREAARARVISSIHARKRAIQKEKDLLDAADSNALLYNSSGFTAGQPASPGGSHSNRKTRHTRHHRHDPDNADSAEGGKRKRKAPMDMDEQSPGPNGMRNPAEASAAGLDKGRLIEHESATPGSVDRYFSAKELAFQARATNLLVAQFWAEKRAVPMAQNGSTANGIPHLTSGDLLDVDVRMTRGRRHSDADGDAHQDLETLVAPAMDRTGSHATRSTRNNIVQPEPSILARESLEALDDPRRVYGVAVLDAVAARAKAAGTKDVEAPLTSGLNVNEQTEDMALYSKLMNEAV